MEAMGEVGNLDFLSLEQEDCWQWGHSCMPSSELEQ